MAGRPKRDKMDDYPKHKNVDAELERLAQVTRDLKVAKAYERSLLAKQQDVIRAIRSKRKPNGDVVGLQELADAAGLSFQRIAQITSGKGRYAPKPATPASPAVEQTA